jgi:hypothetical protein
MQILKPKFPCSGAVGPMFLGGPRAVLFRQTKNFSDKPKNFPDDNILNLHLPSTTLTISDNLDNFPTISDNIGNFPMGLNNRGGHGPPCPPPGHGATAPMKPVLTPRHALPRVFLLRDSFARQCRGRSKLLLLLFSHLLTRCLINSTITKYIYIYIQIKMVAFH